MLILNSPQVAQETALRWRHEHRIALVPTMGCLHAGHLSLIQRASDIADKVIVSIFVNPLQFGPSEDFERYPRPFDSDVEKLEKEGVALLFHPDPEDFYPSGFSARVLINNLTQHLCSQQRPGHFEGVTTVCLKLFQIAQPDFAVFGEKDFQQLKIIERMVMDLNLPLRIVPHPTVREADGLALSSRNVYLGQEERTLAGRIPTALFSAQDDARANPNVTIGSLKEKILDQWNLLSPDYIEIVEEKMLAPLSDSTAIGSIERPRLMVAVKIGKTRLIDNISLGPA